MDTDPLSTLEKLPNLTILVLDEHCFTGVKLTCHAMGFPKLKSLYIGYSANLEMWDVENGAMPHLCYLTIYNCAILKMIPDGLRFLTSLEELVIRRMPEEFVIRVEVCADGEEGEDFDKIRHIPDVLIQ
ncbi:antimicrobial response protein [Lithospermum erythrorhizon]|uniref:Antimicrobial response protein n=1 Tax=Lithospermum erythrorhizon TaxID=34254 RepID=A0AAV3Q4W9_LITER